MNYYQNYDDGLVYTEDEAKRYTTESLTKNDLAEAMAGHYRLVDLFNLIPEEEQAIIIQEAIDFKMFELFSSHVDTDDLMFAHNCPGHEV